MALPLTSEEIDACREAFAAFEREGCVDLWGLRQVIEAMGTKPTEEELFTMVSSVDTERKGEISAWGGGC